jgi:CBS domain-containing protein
VSRRTTGGDVLDQMEQRKITSVVVVEDGGQQVAGVVHLHDLLGTQTI